MAYTKYSLTPANNNATPPDGAPEGMLPSAVNDTMRDMMAQIRDCGDGIRDGTYTMTAPKITGGTITGSSINNTAIGGSTPAAGAFTTLSASGVATMSAGTASAPAITTTGDTNTGIFFPAADTIAFTEGGAEAMRINDAGSLLVKQTGSYDPTGGTAFPTTQITTTGTGTALGLFAWANEQTAPAIRSAKSRGTSEGSYTVVQNGDVLMNMAAYGSDGTKFVIGANIQAVVNGTPGANDMPTVLVFGTTADGASTVTERMRIAPTGEVYIAGTTDQGAYNLQVAGTGVWGAGAYVNGSDARIKNDIAPLNSGLDVVAKLNPVTYKYKQNWSKDQSTQTGFIAQELLTALEGKNYVDGIVQQNANYMSVAYQNIIPILTKAIQEQQAMIEELKSEVALLKSK